MDAVERFRNALEFCPVDRMPMVEWAPWWDKTLDRWHDEGLPREVTGVEQVAAYFGLDVMHQLWVHPRADTCPQAPSHGAPVISTVDQYDAFIDAGHLYPDPAFDVETFRGWADKQAAGEVAIWITFDGFFWYPRTLLGIEPHMYAFYDQPELMHRMNRDLVDHSLKVLDAICEICTPVFMTLAEDMSYNHGPMLSKDCFDEFLAPYYREMIPAVKARGITPIVDSDGDVTALIPWLTDVGIEGILPLERMAGVDVAGIRADHPDFKMIGAFDKTVMHRGEPAVRAEFERLLPTMRSGGFIASVDHQTPPGVSLEQYRAYVELLREYCAKAAM